MDLEQTELLLVHAVIAGRVERVKEHQCDADHAGQDDSLRRLGCKRSSVVCGAVQ